MRRGRRGARTFQKPSGDLCETEPSSRVTPGPSRLFSPSKPLTRSSQKPAFAQCSIANEAPRETERSSEP